MQNDALAQNYQIVVGRRFSRAKIRLLSEFTADINLTDILRRCVALQNFPPIARNGDKHRRGICSTPSFWKSYASSVGSGLDGSNSTPSPRPVPPFRSLELSPSFDFVIGRVFSKILYETPREMLIEVVWISKCGIVGVY
ncbi:hypothetical protein GWI33_015307 [Rhynchophorus ferrugineus]|uniref:Uncharacterized protein n=1 Tax=Rhynchophorus ferrugineus TaxID=354439 RepID=A0A834IDH5_RHYFE|nr:hypothetical protein GWI33_015307 [Rhynchophorus ferrugineus]